jgi:hypothetical protein
MRRLTATVFLALGVLAGCRNDPARELLHREMRWMEDEIYMLQDELDAAQSQLDSCRKENEALRKELGGEPANATRGPAADEGFRPPAVELETPDSPPSRPILDAPPENPPESLPGPDDSARLEPRPPRLERPASARLAPYTVDRITLNRLLTGGLDQDGIPGDEGLLVVIEPRNEEGKIVSAAAACSIVVLDPALNGPEARVARWDFTPEEVAGRYRKSPLGEGVHVEMPWPSNPPMHTELTLVVRLETPEGHRYVAEREIRVDLLGDDEGPRDKAAAAPLDSAPPPAAEEDGSAPATAARRKRPEWRPYR